MISNRIKPRLLRLMACVLAACVLFAVLPRANAVYISPGGTNISRSITPLDSWSFRDSTNWTSDRGYAPVSFTNLNFSYLGDGASLVVNSNVPAWLQYNIYETNGATNLTVDIGSVEFWFAPNWASTNQGGNGPGEWGRLLEVGGYSPDSSYGLWSIYVDDVGANIYFSAQTNDLSSNLTTYVSAPIGWTTNYWHYVVLTYSATNTVLYLDGVMATSGPPVTVFPGHEVLTNGFFMGSDSNGVWQAQGMFNSVATYNVPLDADWIQRRFNQGFGWYMMNPWNSLYMANIKSAPFVPSTSGTPDVITGPGYLLWGGGAPYSAPSTNVWMTNVLAHTTNGATSVTFSIEGGLNGQYYDVFATTALTSPITNGIWYWMGQGPRTNIYTIPNLTNSTVFLILGTPQDTDGDGLTDAYELLVSHTNPTNSYTDGAGINDGWQVLLGLNPLVNQVAQPSTSSNYGYTPADWLNGVSGVRAGIVTNDAEGNVLQVSQ